MPRSDSPSDDAGPTLLRLPAVAAHSRRRVPHATTPLVGRQAELARVRDLLDGGAHLLTLTGPGGIGKTRLATELCCLHAGAFADGACFVPLAAVRTIEGARAAIVAQLPGPGGSAELNVETTLRDLELLLVLDNLEQLPGAAGLVAEILETAPSVTVVATSRSSLGLVGRGEQLVILSPLAAPSPAPAEGTAADEIETADAVSLFVQRTRALRQGFTLTDANAWAVAEICRRLDGLPLAIELAAARCRILSPAALLSRLDGQPSTLDLIGAAGPGVTGRHRTLRDTIGWSFDLLPDDERRLLGAVALFTGPWTLEAAEAVGGPLPGSAPLDPPSNPDRPSSLDRSSTLDRVAALVDASLVTVTEEPDGELRFELPESVREFALEQVAAGGDEPAIRRRHADLVERQANETAAAFRAGRTSLRTLRATYERIRANVWEQLGWMLDADPVRALPLGHAVLGIWGLYYDALQPGMIETALAGRWAALALAEATEPVVRARAMLVAGDRLIRDRERSTEGERLAAEAARGFAEAGLPQLQAEALAVQGIALVIRDDPAAEALLTTSLEIFQRVGAPAELAYALNNLAYLRHRAGQPEAALELANAALDHAHAADDSSFVTAILNTLGEILQAIGETSRGTELLRQTLHNAVADGQPDAVVAGFVHVLATAVATEHPRLAARALGAVAAVASTDTLFGHTGREEPETAALDAIVAAIGVSASRRELLAGRALSLVQAAALLEDALAAEPDSTGSTDSPATSRSLAAPDERLTARELQVLRLLAQGHSDREIGAALFVSRRTAATHVGSILRKLQVSSRTAAAATAVRSGLIPLLLAAVLPLL